MKVTVGQRAHVRHRLANRVLLPELVAKHVPFAWRQSPDTRHTWHSVVDIFVQTDDRHAHRPREVVQNIREKIYDLN